MQPIKALSEQVLWKGDARVIDGAVHGTGTIVVEIGAVVRMIQTGSMRTYAVSVLLGVVLIVGYYLWAMIPFLTALVVVPLAGIGIIAMIDSSPRSGYSPCRAGGVARGLRPHAAGVGAVRRAVQPTFSLSSATRGFQRSESNTSSASMASACSWSS